MQHAVAAGARLDVKQQVVAQRSELMVPEVARGCTPPRGARPGSALQRAQRARGDLRGEHGRRLGRHACLRARVCACLCACCVLCVRERVCAAVVAVAVCDVPSVPCCQSVRVRTSAAHAWGVCAACMRARACVLTVLLLPVKIGSCYQLQLQKSLDPQPWAPWPYK